LASAQLLIIPLLCICTQLAPRSALAAPLTNKQTRLIQYVDAHKDDALKLLERVVNINSGTQNLEGVRAVGKVFQAQLEALGFDTRWIDGAAFQRAGHLVATHAGSGPGILLIGHLDTVFAIDSPFQKFQRIDAHTARGPGVIDMKGGDVIIVQTLRALHAQGLLAGMNIRMVMNGDEERVGTPVSLARQALLDAARKSTYAIAFEDGDGDPTTAVIARRGSSNWHLRVTGTPAHSSQIFRADIGAGAIYETARILSGFYRELHGQANLTFNPGLVVGGTQARIDPHTARGTAFGKSNVISGVSEVSGDLRTISIAQRERAKTRMQAVVALHLPHTMAKIKFSDHYPPLAPSDGNRKLLALLDSTSRDLGFGPVSAVDPAKAGAADVSFTAGLVPAAIDGLGLMGDGGHTVHETADLRTLPMQSKRSAVLISRLLGDPATTSP